jgi:hypothetical protein
MLAKGDDSSLLRLAENMLSALGANGLLEY